MPTSLDFEAAPLLASAQRLNVQPQAARTYYCEFELLARVD